MGMKPPCCLARVLIGGVGVDMHVFFVHIFNEFMIYWNFSCACSHYVGVSWLH